MQPLNNLNSMSPNTSSQATNGPHQLQQQMAPQQMAMSNYPFPAYQYGNAINPLNQMGQMTPSLPSPSGLGVSGVGGAASGASPQGQQANRNQNQMMPVQMHQYYYSTPFPQSMYPYSPYPHQYYSGYGQPSTPINTTTSSIGHTIPQPKPAPLPKAKKLPKEKKVKQKIPKPPKQPKGILRN